MTETTPRKRKPSDKLPLGHMEVRTSVSSLRESYKLDPFFVAGTDTVRVISDIGDLLTTELILFQQTLAAISSCIIALLEQPDVLVKAQAELDRVVQPGHLPDVEDQDSLPYITALAMEALRWRDVVPLGKLYPNLFI